MKTAIVTAAALASIIAGTLTARADDTPMIRDLGTPDTAIRTTDGFVQVDYLDFHYANRDRAGYVLYEDGSAAIDSADGCYRDSIRGRVALRDC